MITILFLLMGAVFTAFAGAAYERRHYFVMVMCGLYAIYCFGYFIAVVGTLPTP